MARPYDFSKAVRRRYADRTLSFQHAPQTRIDARAHLARELFSTILGISYDDCLVTDESELRDFVTDETPADFKRRFSARYGFDLPGDTRARIVDIVEQIASGRGRSRA